MSIFGRDTYCPFPNTSGTLRYGMAFEIVQLPASRTCVAFFSNYHKTKYVPECATLVAETSIDVSFVGRKVCRQQKRDEKKWEKFKAKELSI